MLVAFPIEGGGFTFGYGREKMEIKKTQTPVAESAISERISIFAAPVPPPPSPSRSYHIFNDKTIISNDNPDQEFAIMAELMNFYAHFFPVKNETGHVIYYSCRLEGNVISKGWEPSGDIKLRLMLTLKDPDGTTTATELNDFRLTAYQFNNWNRGTVPTNGYSWEDYDDLRKDEFDRIDTIRFLIDPTPWYVPRYEPLDVD